MAQEVTLDRFGEYTFLYFGELGIDVPLKNAAGEDIVGSEAETILKRVIPEYAKRGHVVVSGIAGSLFSEDEQTAYASARELLEKRKSELVTKADVKKMVNLATIISRILEDEKAMILHEAHSKGRALANAMKDYKALVDNAELLVGPRYELMRSTLESLENRVLVLQGPNDKGFAEWPLVRPSHHVEDKFIPKLKIAHIDGFNYNTGGGYYDNVPEEMRTRHNDAQTYDILTTPFDVLFFSGNYGTLKPLIAAVNAEASKKKRGKRGENAGIHRKVIIVNDPYLKKPEHFLTIEDDNLVVRGLNFERDRTLLLAEYHNNAFAVLKHRIGATEGLGDNYEVLDCQTYKHGVLGPWDIHKSKDVLSLKAHQDMSESTLKNLYHAGRRFGEVVQPKSGCGRILVPLVAAGLGAVVTYAIVAEKMAENAAELQRRDGILNGLREDIKTYQHLVDEATK